MYKMYNHLKMYLLYYISAWVHRGFCIVRSIKIFQRKENCHLYCHSRNLILSHAQNSSRRCKLLGYVNIT